MTQTVGNMLIGAVFALGTVAIAEGILLLGRIRVFIRYAEELTDRITGPAPADETPTDEQPAIDTVERTIGGHTFRVRGDA